MRDELERILPLQNMQEYLLHEYLYSWAEYRTKSREKLIDYIEKNGYEQELEYYNGKVIRIKYVVVGNYHTQFIFDMNNKMFYSYFERDDEEEMPAWVEMKHLKAINKQVEELEWNNINGTI